MKKKSIIISIIGILLIIIALDPMWFHMFVLHLKYDVGGYIIEKRAEMREYFAREENTKVAEKWIKDTYGATISEIIKLKYDGKDESGAGWSDWSHFIFEAPFAYGSIMVSSKNHKIESGGFNLGKDSTFHQLYSEWVKKQIGCEDENVKIEFYVEDEPFIDFKQIESISDDYSEIFKNVYTYKLRRIYIKNFPNLSLDNFVNYVKNFVNEKYSKLASLSSFTGGFIILAYGYDYDMYANSSQYVKYYGTKENINNYLMGVFNGGKLDNEVTYFYMDEKKGTYYEDVIIIS